MPMQTLRQIAKHILPMSVLRQMKNFYILAFEYGQAKTIRTGKSVDTHSNPIPWYTYPAIDFLNTLDFSNKTVFEYGSGNSSLFWSQRCGHVTSVEHDIEWFSSMQKQVTLNNTLLLREGNGRYESSINEQNELFDVVVIDGIRRRECAQTLRSMLNTSASDGCMVILDNAERYPDIARYLRDELNLIQCDFSGFGPINAYTWTTSLFLSRDFNFPHLDEAYYSTGSLRPL